jgi:hypothetical protein
MNLLAPLVMGTHSERLTTQALELDRCPSIDLKSVDNPDHRLSPESQVPARDIAESKPARLGKDRDLAMTASKANSRCLYQDDPLFCGAPS